MELMMKTLVQRVFGNSINSEDTVLSAFPNSKLEEVSRELQKKLELKRALDAKRTAEMSVDEKIALALSELRKKSVKTASRDGSLYGESR
jgi:hypothetical protein